MKRSAGGCSSCGDGDGDGDGGGWVLHKVWQKATLRVLCTNCVLISSPGLFCPLCLQVFEQVPPVPHRLMCLKCPSVCHLSCSDAASSFLCPPCSDPHFFFFNLASSSSSKRIKLLDYHHHHHRDPSRSNNLFIDKNNAKALLAASRIAAASMSKAAIAARADAERRVKEALAAKLCAKEALQRLAYLLAKDNLKDAHDTDLITVEALTTYP